jgi:L-alanine-DL-glutamate epimerase-like enolase superfamily enzyme
MISRRKTRNSLVTPLHTFPNYEEILGDHFVGLRGGPVYAVLVRVTTDEGLDGIGSAVISHLNSPMAQYFPSTPEGGVLDDDTLFWELFTGEPRAENGFIRLPDTPGLGLDLNWPQIRKWRLPAA